MRLYWAQIVQMLPREFAPFVGNMPYFGAIQTSCPYRQRILSRGMSGAFTVSGIYEYDADSPKVRKEYRKTLAKRRREEHGRSNE